NIIFLLLPLLKVIGSALRTSAGIHISCVWRCLERTRPRLHLLMCDLRQKPVTASKNFLGQSDSAQGALFSADGKRLITGDAEGSVKLWDLTTRRELMTLNRYAGLSSMV